MAIRIQLPSTKVPAAKPEAVFSNDRAAALARLAKQQPNSSGAATPPLPAGAVRAPATPGGVRTPVFKTSKPGAPSSLPPPPGVVFPPTPRGVVLPPARFKTSVPPAPTEAGGAEVATAEHAAADVSAPLPPGAGAASDGAPAAEGDYASEALLDSSAAPSRIRAVGVLVKWTVILVVFLGICYAAMRFVFPFLQELHHPTKSGTVVDKDAPTAVKMLQQTRAVIDQNNKNVSHVNDIAAVALNEKTSPPPPAAASSAPVIRPKPPSVDVTPAYLEPYQAAISRLKISGVALEPEERAYVNGRVVKFGDIVDRDLAIRFMGVDAANKVLLFTNADNVVFKMHY